MKKFVAVLVMVGMCLCCVGPVRSAPTEEVFTEDIKTNLELFLSREGWGDAFSDVKRLLPRITKDGCYSGVMDVLILLEHNIDGYEEHGVPYSSVQAYKNAFAYIVSIHIKMLNIIKSSQNNKGQKKFDDAVTLFAIATKLGTRITNLIIDEENVDLFFDVMQLIYDDKYVGKHLKSVVYNNSIWGDINKGGLELNK